MIIDKIENIVLYKEISDEVINFIKTLSDKTPLGRKVLSDNVYANVEEYDTKRLENCKFEAHKKYIDIQILLSGVEQLDYMNISGLSVKEEYDCNRDIMFFDDNPNKTPDSVILEPNKFALIFPHEAHKPQVALNNIPQKVKKVVVKIKI